MLYVICHPSENRGPLLNGAQRLVEFYTEKGYHPRSSKHGDVLCDFLLDDLMRECPAFRQAAVKGTICYQQNPKGKSNTPLAWKLDLAIGPTLRTPDLANVKVPIRAPPDDLWIAVDAKSIMTEHGKARRNRQRDLNSLAAIIHMKNPRTVVGGLVVINVAPSFRSPTRKGEITIHKNIDRLVAESVRLFEDLPRAPARGLEGGNLNEIDAIGVIVVDYTNIKDTPARLVTEPPAPQPGSPLHYDCFVRTICEAFTARFITLPRDGDLQ